MDTENGHTSIRTRNILFLTNAECGQSNTILALALEASTRHHLEVHIASFPVLKLRVERLSSKLKFHPLDSETMIKIGETQKLFDQNLPHLPATKSFAAYDKLLQFLWDGECAFSPFYMYLGQ